MERKWLLTPCLTLRRENAFLPLHLQINSDPCLVEHRLCKMKMYNVSFNKSCIQNKQKTN